jgi:uncharacterized protein
LILLDTSGMLAALAANQQSHAEARAALEQARPPYILSPFVLAELDYLIAREGGQAAEVAFLHEVAAGAYDLVPFVHDDVVMATTVIEQYRDLQIGLADASIVVLAGRLGAVDLLTLDERHFRALRTPSGKPFRILPADV